MAQIEAQVSRQYSKPRITIYYNEQEEKYQGLLEDEGRPEGNIQFELSAATLTALKADLNTHPNIEVT